MTSGSLSGRASTLATTGTTGARIDAEARASAISSAAGCISGQWKGAETFSGIARAPSSLAFSMARSTAAFSPEMTMFPALLSLATTQTPTSEPAAAAADPLWLPLVNLLAWTAVFAVVCLLASRSRTARA